MEIVINREKFWNISSICYITFWMILHILIYNDVMQHSQGIQVVFGIIAFTLIIDCGCVQVLPLFLSVRRLNDYYSLRERIPLYIRFDGHEQPNRKEDKQ